MGTMEDNKDLKNTLNEGIEIEEIVDTTSPQTTVVKKSEVFSSNVSEHKDRKEIADEVLKDIYEKASINYKKLNKETNTVKPNQTINKLMEESKADKQLEKRIKKVFEKKPEKKQDKKIEEIEKEVKKEKLKSNLKKIFKKKEKVKVEPTVNKTPTITLSNIDTSIPSKPIKKKKRKGPLTKKEKRLVRWATIVWVVIVLALIGVGCGIGFVSYFTSDKPQLVVSDLKAPDSTTVYDNEGNKLIELGLYLRENIDYDQMPNCLIDAFVSIEDSRFFDHIGFDVPRFTKAIIANLRSGDFGQGGSTITMQLIKNTYFSIDDGENSTLAAREGMSGIKRKLEEIMMSIDLTLGNKLSKKDTIAYYINKVNYGNNIRGVQKAAQYYFGKDAKDINLSEAAFLAGVINSPNYNNPYNNQYLEPEDFTDINYLENGTERRNEVLNLMVYHGYISEEECELAKSIKLEDMLVGEGDTFAATNEFCQGYIDRVIDEVIETTGNDPYRVGMRIYTNMDSHMQQLVYDMQNEKEYTGIKFSNDMMQNAIVVLNNQDGSIVALGGGRGKTKGARQLNRATDCYLNPGSSIKPVVDYSLAFDQLGWATNHVITDRPIYLYSGNVLIKNFSNYYNGDVTVVEAVGRSLNTPAVQTLTSVIEATSEEWVVDYLNSIGFKFDYEDFDLQFAIGGNRCLVTPLQLAGAHAIFINKGVYVAPHCVEHIEYIDGREDYVADTKGFQAISEEAAYLTAYCESKVISGQYSSTADMIRQDYPVYVKTGTTDWGDGHPEYNVPAGSTKDCWLVAQTNKYTITTWLGYDVLQERSYFTNSEYYDNTKSYIVKYLLEALEEHFTKEDGYDPYPGIEKPEGIVDVTHTLGAYPYTYPSGAYASSTGMIAKSSLEKNPLVSESSVLSTLQVKNSCSFVNQMTAGIAEGNAVLSFAVAVPTGEQVGANVDLSTTNLYKDTTHFMGKAFFPHYIYNITYTGTDVNYEILNADEVVIANGTTNQPSVSVPLPQITHDMRACAWTGDDHGGRLCVDLN